MTNQLQHQQRRAVDLRIPAIEKYAYCLCLHVKPTTIFIAVFKLIRALLFASILLNAEFTVNEQINEFGIPTLEERHKSTAIAIEILRRIVMASVSAVGIYAVISGRAALLMPLYAILLIDFFFALPSFYKWDMDPSVADSLADFKNISTTNNAYTRYSLLLFSTITMIVKIYFLCVIWKCYRYLRLIELVSPLRLSEIYPHIHQNGPQYPIVRVLGSVDSSDLVNGHNMAPPPYESIASSMKPPNYEEAMKTSDMNFATNPNPTNNQQQQQTVVITSINSNELYQNTSTQIVNDTNVRPTATHTNLNDNVVSIPVQTVLGDSTNNNDCDYINNDNTNAAISNDPRDTFANSSSCQDHQNNKNLSTQVSGSNNNDSIEININNDAPVTQRKDIPK